MRDPSGAAPSAVLGPYRTRPRIRGYHEFLHWWYVTYGGVCHVRALRRWSWQGGRGVARGQPSISNTLQRVGNATTLPGSPHRPMHACMIDGPWGCRNGGTVHGDRAMLMLHAALLTRSRSVGRLISEGGGRVGRSGLVRGQGVLYTHVTCRGSASMLCLRTI